MQKQDYLKIMAIVILLLLIFDVVAILHINGYKPTITSKEMKAQTKEVEESSIEVIDKLIFDDNLLNILSDSKKWH